MHSMYYLSFSYFFFLKCVRDLLLQVLFPVEQVLILMHMFRVISIEAQEEQRLECAHMRACAHTHRRAHVSTDSSTQQPI